MGYRGAGGKVVFDFEGSLDLARKLWALADALETEDRGRQGEYEIAKAKFQGAYADQFVGRRDTERSSASTVIESLRVDARGWASAWAKAKYQQNVNDRVAKVETMRQSRSMWEKFGDAVMGYDDTDDQVPAAQSVPTPVPPSFSPTT